MSASPEVLILGHHKIGPIPPGGWTSWYYVPAEAFAAQLRWLKEEGYAYLGLDAFLRGLDDPASLPPKSVLVTFDDGYRSLFEYGLPELRAAGCPAVIFVPTDYVGRDNAFDYGNEPREPICTWDDLRALEAAGVAVQPHGTSHGAFSTFDAERLGHEIGASKREIEGRLGRPVSLFSFPYGDNSAHPDRVDALLRAHGYRAACLYNAPPVPFPPPNPYRLGRVALGSDTDLAAAVAALKNS